MLFKFYHHFNLFFAFGWILYPRIVYLHYVVILSWLLNENRSILPKLQYYFFNEAFMEKDKKYIVPKYTRYILYANCATGTLYNIFNYIPLILLVMGFYLYHNKDKTLLNIYKTYVIGTL